MLATGYWLFVLKSDGHCSGEIEREKERGVKMEEFRVCFFLLL